LLHTTVGVLQQSALVAHGPPSGEPVHALHCAGSFVHTMPPLPFDTQPQPQQSLAVVHAPPSATHIAPHRSVPVASGTHTRPQHTSEKSHWAPSGRQHRSVVLPVLGAHVMSGYASTQHSAVVVHA
jgi:hypothetical protein